MTDAQFKQLMELGHRLIDKKEGRIEKPRPMRKCGIEYCAVRLSDDKYAIRHKWNIFCSESHKLYFQGQEEYAE